MKKAFRQRIVDRHRDSLNRFGYGPAALYWSSQEIQDLRFKVLSEIGVQAGDSVLDVGCGFADLKAWFGCEHKTVDYTGIDISPDLIAVAKEKQPNTSLYVGELKDCRFHALSFDWVLLSGALNEPYNDKGKYTKKIIKEMYRISRRGIAFNLLNKRCINVSDLQSFEPDEIFEFCQTIGAECELRTDYLENDFTIYMRKT